MITYIVEHPEVIAAFLSFIATVFAAYATWQGPRSAATLAEQLRSAAAAEGQAIAAKRYIFYTLMQERAAISSAESVRALNSIDIVFIVLVRSEKHGQAFMRLFLRRTIFRDMFKASAMPNYSKQWRQILVYQMILD